MSDNCRHDIRYKPSVKDVRMNMSTTLSALIFFMGSCLLNQALAQKIEGQSIESEVKKAVLAGLKDPDSAKFGSFKLIDEEHACLTVNAKNAMGGYTGNQQAFVQKVDGYWFLLTAEGMSQDQCVVVFNKLIKNEKK